MVGESFAIELRDPSEAGRAEIEAAVCRMGGRVDGTGLRLTVSAPTPNQVTAIRSMLMNDPRVISDEQRAVVAAQERLAEHQAEVEAAQRADQVAQLEARVAEQAKRIAELEAR
jgi:hypothetical protein